ncbi:G patch domain-containing protein 1 homolog isoform X2 [Aricia agestis]|uniref:G patch domain-containing protein 1 homolog isoform X2 n=1 Tax=Aricia agestis TaxID=91739 RepID=UPI001C2037FD|nr:G patch domain-containing protein 1 homolog isoform X2 [Aricia agestis]
MCRLSSRKGVMSGSESDEENVIKYGTPLEPYDEDEIPSKRKFQQPSDQYAVDTHGRRRFHGAFTGGFSAGYGNSVGTPEGWTPASFKSSRTEKAAISNQRPEDYMDDEDRGEFGIAPQTLQTQAEFSGQKRQRQRYHDGPIPGEPVLEQLVRAVHETAAVKLLRRMGWRPGPAHRPARRKTTQQKVYGCYVPPEMRQSQESQESASASSESEFEYEDLFEAEEHERQAAMRKSDRFGIGYTGLSRRSVLGGDGGPTSHLVMKDKGKRVSIRGQAFGVGAFEADDEDIYAADDMSRYDRAIGPPPPPDNDKHTRKVAKSGNVLEGFVKASGAERAAPRHPPPALPRDYRPAPAPAARTRFEPTDKPQRDQGLGRHELSAAARGALLGETPLSRAEERPRPPVAAAPPVKVVDLTAAGAAPAAPSEDFIPVGGSGGPPRVFRPFVADPPKQARYERYLAGGACERDSASALAEWERDREMREFEQAAKLYRPLTGAMSDRFTHAAEPDDAANPLSAVSRSAACGAATAAQADAARRGVYGVMTRTHASWRPEPLVCKRFNVPEIGGGRSEPTKRDKPDVSYSIFSYLESSVHDRESFTREQTKFSGSKSLADAPPPPPAPAAAGGADTRPGVGGRELGDDGAPNKRMTVAELFLKESERAVEKSEKVQDTIEKFDRLDLYKSIFLSDSEPEEAAAGAPDGSEVEPRNTERNTSPPRGIFAGIDFDELNSWRRSAAEPPEPEKVPSDARPTDKKTDAGEDDAVYGPKIPDDLKQRITSGESGPRPRRDSGGESSGEDSWVDATELNNKHKNKKHKKHKSKHKKTKHKKKDK